jgi:antitoxin (DNA-binding transcriptional repressor) of toxin-antitoxin stability system
VIDEAAVGEAIVITRRGVPVARLIALKRPGQRRFGALAGSVAIDDRFFEPLPPDELEGW